MRESPRPMFKKTRVEKSGSKDIRLAEKKKKINSQRMCSLYEIKIPTLAVYTTAPAGARIAHDNDVKKN